MSEHPIDGLMSSAMEGIKSMVDANTIIGDPISLPDGTTVIPVSKVSFGFASGGSEFPAKNDTRPQLPFGGASGAGVTIIPIAFLVSCEEGVKLIPVTTEFSSVDRAISMIPDAVNKVTEVIQNLQKEKKAKKEAEQADAKE